MPYKPRTKPKELEVLEILNTRMNLPSNYQNEYFNLKKGYEGELHFDSLTNKLQCERLMLNGLLLSKNNQLFQIDTLMLAHEKIYNYEVKNFEGDFNYEDEKFIKLPNIEYSNPLIQLERSESLLRQLLFQHGYNLPIISFVVFINPKFTLYQAPLNKPIIYPTQVKTHLGNINSKPSKINKKHKNLADQLISLNVEDHPYKKLPPYNFDQLKKGISCKKCHGLFVYVQNRTCICKKCGHKEAFKSAVLRAIQEFKVLFPDEKLTTNKIYDWCKVVDSKKRINRLLTNNFKIRGVHQWAYYE